MKKNLGRLTIVAICLLSASLLLYHFAFKGQFSESGQHGIITLSGADNPAASAGFDVQSATTSNSAPELSGLNDFLGEKAKEQQLRAKALAIRGLNSHEQDMLRLYDEAKIDPPSPQQKPSAEQLSALNKAFKLQVVQLVEALGISPDRARELTAKGQNPFEAAANHIRGRSTPIQEIALSDSSAIVNVRDRASENLSDGFGSTATASVQKNISGNPSDTIYFRQYSGDTPNGTFKSVSSEIVPGDGQSYLIGFSKSFYEQLTLEHRLQTAQSAASPLSDKQGKITAIFSPPYVVVGDNLVPAGNSPAEGGSLQAVTDKAKYLNSSTGR